MITPPRWCWDRSRSRPKSNEIPALRDLLAGFADLGDVVITADAMHTQRVTAGYIVGRGGHYVFTVKNNQPSLYQACKQLPWRDVPSHTSVDETHGRRVRRGIKAVQAPAWLDFDHAAQIAQIRRTRTRTRKTVEVVYVISSHDTTTAPPATIASWVQGHWGIENRLCATRRLITFPAQLGGIRRNVPGSDDLPGSER